MKIDTPLNSRHLKRLLRDPSGRHAWIKFQLTLRNKSLADVAREEGVARQCLYQVFHRHYPRMEVAISNALDMTPQELWPDRYDADGLPKGRGRGRPKKINTKGRITSRRAGASPRKRAKKSGKKKKKSGA